MTARDRGGYALGATWRQVVCSAVITIGITVAVWNHATFRATERAWNDMGWYKQYCECDDANCEQWRWHTEGITRYGPVVLIEEFDD